MNDEAITIVLDVGAHIGDYASSLRRFGHKGRIESFEPLARAQLSSRAAGDPLRTGHRLALGDRSGTLTLHVAGNEVSSSALDMLPRHVQGDPASSYVGSEQVSVRTLDELGLTGAADHAYPKADVQGFEQRVLAGAGRTPGVGPGCWSWSCHWSSCTRIVHGSRRCSSTSRTSTSNPSGSSGFNDADTGRLLQMDGIFAKRETAL